MDYWGRTGHFSDGNSAAAAAAAVMWSNLESGESDQSWPVRLGIRLALLLTNSDKAKL